jgi:hypothetical protein
MRILAISGICLCLFACTNRRSVPPGIIQPDSMQVILRDVILADQFATQYLLKDSLLKDSVHRNVKAETLQLYETVFRLHKVSREVFRKSMDFYYSRPDLVKTMFDSLAAYETRHRNELYMPRNTPALEKKDSLRIVSRDSLKLHTRDSLKADSLKRKQKDLPKRHLKLS